MRVSIALVAAAVGTVGGLSFAPVARAQLRLAEWNVTNYSGPGTRDAAFKTALYAIAPNGLQFAPDVLVIEEVIQSGSSGQTNVNAFLSILNTAAGSPGDWAAAPYQVNGGDTGNAMFYRTSKIVWLGTSALTTDTGTGPNQAPRDTQRWRVRLVGYTGVGAEMYLYGAHYKASSGNANELRRDPESRRVRIDSNALPDVANFAIFADFNTQSSSEDAYQFLTSLNASPPSGWEFTSDPTGQFFDPILRPGTWENSATFRYIHTQEPSTQMDSRHDQILISGTMRDGHGLDYLGSLSIPYSASTWNDPNHSYRCWGNDGSTFNLPMAIAGNAMVGPTIAQALVDSVNGGGHLPVFLDAQVPAKVSAPVTVNFGTVNQNSVAQVTIQVGNGANVALWSRTGNGAGIDVLNYTMSASSGFTAPAGGFTDAAAGTLNSHTLTMSTSTPGNKAGTLTITSDDPDSPTLVINLSGVVGSLFDYDVDNDGLVNAEDLHRWYGLFTDVDGSGGADAADVAALRTELRRLEVAGMTAGLR